MRLKIILFVFANCCLSSVLALNDEHCEGKYRVGIISVVVKQPHKIIEENLNYPLFKFIYQSSRKSTIEKYMTFKTGELFNLKKIKESVRKLRAQKFIWDAFYNINIRSHCKKDVVLTVNDTFPFKPKISYSRRNGTNKSSVGIVNSNIFGTGNSLKFEYKQEELRDQKIIRYVNPNFGDDHYQFTGLYSSNSDGNESLYRFAKPFHDIFSKNAYELSLNEFRGNFSLYDSSEVIFTSLYNTKKFKVGYAYLSDYNFGFQTARTDFNLTIEEAQYEQSSIYNQKQIRLNTTFELFDTDFIQIKNIRNMSKFEDFNKGFNFSIGLSLYKEQIRQSWGSGFNLIAHQSFLPNDLTLFSYDLNFSSDWFNDSQFDRMSFAFKFEFNRFSVGYQQSWNAKLAYNVLDNAKPEDLFLMDEEFAIRGYPFGYRMGDSILTLNIEKRWFNLARFFDTFDIAGTAFVDYGKISNEQSELMDKASTNLSSFGVGLRISPTKLSNNTVIHIDLAFPQGNDIEQNYQLNIFGLNRF